MLRLIRRKWALLRLGMWMRIAAFAEDRIEVLQARLQHLRSQLSQPKESWDGG